MFVHSFVFVTISWNRLLANLEDQVPNLQTPADASRVKQTSASRASSIQKETLLYESLEQELDTVQSCEFDLREEDGRGVVVPTRGDTGRPYFSEESKQSL